MEALKCPVCGRLIGFDHKESDSEYYYCYSCRLEINKDDLKDLGNSICLYIGKNKQYGKCYLIVNPKNGHLFFYMKKFGGKADYYGMYKFNEVQIDVASSKETIYKTNGITLMILGGLLFGTGGAIAGGIVGSNNKSIMERDNYRISITINNLKFSGFVAEIDDANIVHNFVTKIELIRKDLNKENDKIDTKEEGKAQVHSKDNDIYEKLIKLKKLYDEGIIDLDTYNEKKKKYIDML